MPKIEVNESLFFSLLGRRCDSAQLEDALTAAKAELDGWDQSSSDPDARTIKIELNDTNRPDLWSTAGLARQLRIHSGGGRPSYPFFSREGEARAAVRKVVVEESVGRVRPFIAGFIVSGVAMTDAMLKDAIQTQEKLCWNFGRRRRTVSMGLYRTSIIEWPVRYRAVAPESVRFVPLQGERAMNLSEILAEHPKGREYAFILEKEPLHPLLLDAKGSVLSYPPIINSADLGAVQVGDRDLFVELTGTDQPSVTLAASIIACDFADSGWKVEPVAVEYPYDTPFGRSVVCPYYFQAPLAVEAAKVAKLLGKAFSPDSVRRSLERMGCQAEVHGQYVSVSPPEYRNDFLHPVDIIEDVMMGEGMAAFEPQRPRDFTIGRLSPIEAFSRKAKNAMVGLGCQEMIYNYLGNGRDFADRMGLDRAQVARISNPMTENFEYLRNSPLPCLLGTESVSSGAAFPHRTFEVGKVALLRPQDNYGVATRQYLGFILSHQAADYNEAAALVATLLYYLGKDYSVEAAEDPRFIPGRQARVTAGGAEVGVFGELHPRVLDAWGLSMPCAGGEIDLDLLAGTVQGP